MKLHLKWKAMMLFLAIAAAGILTACSAGGQEPPPSQEPAPAPVPGQEQEIDPDKEVLVFAQLSGSNADRSVRRDVIDRFNRSHDDVQIVVKDYSLTATDDQGPDRLLVEMSAGQVPDIIDLGGSLPFHQMVKKGYLEDLWPYIENDPELGREGVLENPLKLSEVDGGLYMLFGAVEIETLIGSAEVVGDRTSWTLRDLQDAFAAMPEGSTVLSFDTSRSAISGSLLRYAAGAYVDREAVLPREYRKAVILKSGICLPTIAVDGVVAGVWNLKKKEPVVEFFTSQPRALQQEALARVEQIGWGTAGRL